MIKHDELSANAKGGTELLKARLSEFLEKEHPEALENIDFYFSRVRDFDENMRSVYYLHDLAGDSETTHLRRNEYDFDAKVFVSYWQYSEYLKHGLITDEQATNNIVIPNSIEFTECDNMWCEKFKNIGTKERPIRLIYHTTPHRGLHILLNVFDEIYKTCLEDEIHITLDVYSSFKIYGWDARDDHYEPLYDFCRDHPAITYHGAVPNAEVVEALKQTHIFAFPSIWPETGCLALIEAMANHNFCVHSSLGALPETSSGCTDMYPFASNPDKHTELFKAKLVSVINRLVHVDSTTYDSLYKAYINVFWKHNWKTNQNLWVKLINQLL